MTTYNLDTYIDFSKLITDPQYATNNYLSVKKQKSVENVSETFSDSYLYLIQYMKYKLTPANNKELGMFRSVLIDGKQILAFSPPKSRPFETFEAENRDISNLRMMEFCEGTMINVFYNSLRGDWEVATRGNIGARCSFYKNCPKTFRTMFLEAMNDLDMEFAYFDKTKSYSFVMQHPDNRIVVPFKEKKLILTNIYSFNGFEVHEASASDVQKEAEKLKCSVPNALNKVVDVENKSMLEIQDLFTTINQDYRIVGAMFINPSTGDRTKIRNSTYEYVRHLKGNSPKLQFQYYNLRKLGKVKEYLHYYPESYTEFDKMRRQLHQWTSTLYRNYCSCYIKKKAILKDFPYQFRPHMFALHKIYLDTFRQEYGYISWDIVKNYANNLEPPRLMFAINYNSNKNKVEHHKVNVEKILTATQNSL